MASAGKNAFEASGAKSASAATLPGTPSENRRCVPGTRLMIKAPELGTAAVYLLGTEVM